VLRQIRFTRYQVLLNGSLLQPLDAGSPVQPKGHPGSVLH